MDLGQEIFEQQAEVSGRYSFAQCVEMARAIREIRILKNQKDVAIFAHSYVNADLLHFVADVVGDSLYLAEQARLRPEKKYLFAAVQFMAETAKLLNREKSVYVAADKPSCSLADSIDGSTVAKLRERYPSATFVCYVNTSAEVKSLCDVCVTSTNAVRVISSIENDEIYFLPDRYMGANLARILAETQPRKTIRFYEGTCEVHERFTVEELEYWRARHPGVYVLAHPECSPEVTARADFVGSTSQISQEIRRSSQQSFLALTECGLASHLQRQGIGTKQLLGSCMLCPYMKSNSFGGILKLLRELESRTPVEIPESIHSRALSSLERMWNC